MDYFKIKQKARKILKKDFWHIIMAIGIELLSMVLYSIIFTFVYNNTESWLYPLLTTFYLLVTAPISFGVSRYLLKAINNRKKTFKDLFYYYNHQVIQVLLLSIINSCVITLGIVMGLFPGIIIYFMLCMSENIIVEQKVNALKAIKNSYNMMRKHKWDYCNFIISFLGLPFLGLFLVTVTNGNLYAYILMIISILIIIPYITIGQKLYYKELKK